jgi:CheY-like chemotaxis protein
VSNSKATILVVDDDEKTRKMMEAMLTPQGYGVILAKDGKESVDVAVRKKPDFILMDMMMPVMDGFSACHEIKRKPGYQRNPGVYTHSSRRSGKPVNGPGNLGSRWIFNQAGRLKRTTKYD